MTAPPGPFLRLVEEAVGERLAAAAPAAPTVVLDVQGDGRPFDRTGFRPLVGKAVAVWGEGASYTGPGGVWLNREP